MTDEELNALGLSRRDFFKKMIALGFAVPVVSTFALDGAASANDWVTTQGNQTHYYEVEPNNTTFRRYQFNQNQGTIWETG